MTGLKILLSLILLVMLAVTTIASLDRGVLEAGAELWPDPWFRATLADAYLGFLVIYLWIAYKEATWARRVLWLVLLMMLGLALVFAVPSPATWLPGVAGYGR